MMKTFYDVQQLLKRFGTVIYTGNRQADLELMLGEVQELYNNGLLDQHSYTNTVLILRRELQKYSDG